MSPEITYTCDNKKYRWRLSMNEVEAMDLLASKGVKKSVDALLGVRDFGRENCIAKNHLRDAVSVLINELERSPLQLYLFNVKAEIPRGSGNYTSGSGQAVCGLKINGDLYDIEYGLDKCIMMKKWQDANMKIHQGEPVDIRELSKIETDSDSFIGDIKIVKRKMSNSLMKNLNKLKTFLEGCTVENVIKVLG